MRWNFFKDYDVIVDGTDNFPTRYLVNDACILLGKPNVYGSIFRFRRPSHGVWHARRPVLPLPVSGAASAGLGAVLRRRRRAWRAARDYRLIAGDGDDQAADWARGVAGGALAAVRCAGA